MKTFVLIATLTIVAIPVFSQKKAVTETGESVLLFDDGTWKYANGETELPAEIKTNPAPFTKDKGASFLLKSTKFNVGFWLDAKKWNFGKATNNPDAEYELQIKEGDLYAMIIAEQLEIPLETLRKIAIDNGKEAAPDLTIVNEEYRTVNGLRVLHLQMQGTMQGIKFFYYGYYFTNSNGTVQFITYSAQNLLSKYQPDIERLLNGMVEL